MTYLNSKIFLKMTAAGATECRPKPSATSFWKSLSDNTTAVISTSGPVGSGALAAG